MKPVLFPFMIVFGFVSCVKEVTLDFRDFQSHLVVNSLLVPDSIIKVNISKSVCSDKEEVFPPVNDAIVEITDGKNVFKLVNSGDGNYTIPVQPVSGGNYALKVISGDGITMSASSDIPFPLNIHLTPIVEDNYVQVTILDNPAEKNVYWVGMRGYRVSEKKYMYESYIESNFLLFDDFNRTRSEDRFMRKTYSYHFYARLTDLSFNGKQADFRIPVYWMKREDNPHDNYRQYLYILNADHHLDQYMKAALVQYELGVIGDMPVFHTPINIYSNISNGKGIFGSYTISQFDITYPEGLP
jgi:hypothetical protein